MFEVQRRAAYTAKQNKKRLLEGFTDIKPILRSCCFSIEGKVNEAFLVSD